MEDIQQVPMDAELRTEFVQWLYRSWAQAMDDLKASNKMEFDKRIHGDRASYEHSKASCIAEATARRDKCKAWLDTYTPYSGLVQSYNASKE